MNSNEKQIAALELELERAVDAAHHVGALKQSAWYQDRKALLIAMRNQTAMQCR